MFHGKQGHFAAVTFKKRTALQISMNKTRGTVRISRYTEYQKVKR